MNKNIVLSLWHSNSRKVAFGLLLFGTTTALLVAKFLNSDQWMLCMASSSALIGGGTLMDKRLDNAKNGNTANTPTVAG